MNSSEYLKQLPWFVFFFRLCNLYPWRSWYSEAAPKLRRWTTFPVVFTSQRRDAVDHETVLIYSDEGHQSPGDGAETQETDQVNRLTELGHGYCNSQLVLSTKSMALRQGRSFWCWFWKFKRTVKVQKVQVLRWYRSCSWLLTTALSRGTCWAGTRTALSFFRSPQRMSSIEHWDVAISYKFLKLLYTGRYVSPYISAHFSTFELNHHGISFVPNSHLLWHTAVCCSCSCGVVRQIFTNHDPIRAIAVAKETTELLPPLGKAFSEENYVVRLEGHVETWRNAGMVILGMKEPDTGLWYII